LSFDILWCFHLTPSGNPFCCQPFYELCLDSLNPFDPSDLFDVSRTEYFLGHMVLLEMILTTFPFELSVYVCVGIIEQSMKEMNMIGIF
jgi:hypothetical protein